jgi:hypothetical protein
VAEGLLVWTGLRSHDQAETVLGLPSAVYRRKAANRGARRGLITDRQVITGVELGCQRDPEAGRIQVIVGVLDQGLPLHAHELLQGIGRPCRCGDSGKVGVSSTLAGLNPVAIHPHLNRPLSRGDEVRIESQDIERRVPGYCLRVDHPEESSALEVQVPHRLVLGLTGGLAHGVGAFGHLAALLGGGQRLNLEWSDLEPRVHSEVVGGDGRRQESGRRRLEGDRPYLDPADDLVLEAFVIHLNVVVGIEVALGVVVHIDVDASSNDPAGSEGGVIVDAGGFEAATAAGVGVQQQDGATAFVAEPLGSNFQPDLAIDVEVGILRQSAEHAPVAIAASFRLRSFQGPAIQGQRQARGGPLGPGRIEHRHHATIPALAPERWRQARGPGPRGVEHRRWFEPERRHAKPGVYAKLPRNLSRPQRG